MESYITSASGRRIDLPDPKPGQLTQVDIATHLSRIPRFVGATSRPYSVAQHSVVVAYLSVAVGQHYARKPLSRVDADALFMEGLLHDAHEAVTGDMPSPLKKLAGREYKRLESRIDASIRRDYGLKSRVPMHVHSADAVALILEDSHLRWGHINRPDAESLLDGLRSDAERDAPSGGDGWLGGALDTLVSEWDWREAMCAFLHEWR